jgi:hypothetical protein
MPATGRSSNPGLRVTDMSDTSRRQAIRNVIGVALASTSSVSLIVSALAEGLDEVTVKTTNGKEIKFTADASVGGVPLSPRVREGRRAEYGRWQVIPSPRNSLSCRTKGQQRRGAEGSAGGDCLDPKS